MPKPIVVDIADLQVTDDPRAELVTYSLGSCIGLALWDPVAKVAGMLHYMLSDSTISPDKADDNPAMFADTGIPLLFRSVYKLGGVKQRLQVKVAGGAAMFQTSERLDIGKHNYIMLRKILWRNNVLIDAEHVGGSISRTLRLDNATGQVTVGNHKMAAVAL